MAINNLRKAIGAIKDQTSISLAKVTNAANLEVAILKATTHDDEIPIEERYINEILNLVSSNKVYAKACVQSIGKRIGKTRNWVVALKSLMIILRIFQDGDPYFPREILHAMKRGSRILNLSGFRDDSNSSPWEFTAFVRLMALYLDERLDCFLTGRLQRRITFKNHHHKSFKNHKMFNDIIAIKDMKPSMILDKITFWQRLLDRAMGIRPTGKAKTNRLVQTSLNVVVLETFDLCKDISDGLLVILDSFFKLPYKECLSAFQVCVKSRRQFDELSDFYSFCLSIQVGNCSEYPKVQKISEELMETLQEFLKDQATTTHYIEVSNHNHHQNAQSSSSSSSSSQYSPLSKHMLISALRENAFVHHYNSRLNEGYERSYGTSSESCFETASEHSLCHCTSLEDLMIATDAGILTPTRFEIGYGDDQDEKQSENNNNDDESSAYESCSSNSYPIDQATRSSSDIFSLDGVKNEGDKEKHEKNIINNNKDSWELVLAETTAPTTFDSLFNQSDSVPHHQYNPFLELDDKTVAPVTNVIDQTQTSLIDLFDDNQNPSEPTIMAPTFIAQSSSFETDSTSNSNTSFGLQDLMENNMALVPAFQENNHGLNSSTSIFQSQGSFKISPTSTCGSYDSCQTSTAQTLSSQNHDSYQISKASTFTSSQGTFKANSSSASQGYELYQTSKAPTSNSQGLFMITSISSFQGPDAYQMSTRPTFNSQNSFKVGSTSTSQSHDSHQTSTIPTVNSQNLFKNSSTSSFHDHDSYQTSTILTVTSQSSFNLSPKSSCQGHNSCQMSIAPTFNSQHSFKNGSTSIFQDHDSYCTSTTTSTLNSQNLFKNNSTPSSQTHESCHSSIALPTFYGHNPNQVSTEPIFQANNPFHTSTRPIFHGQSPSQMNTESTFHAYSSHLTSPMPPFYGNDSSQTRREPTFQTHNSHQTGTLPSFHTHNSYETSTTPSPTFRVQNNNCPMVEATPTTISRNSNNEAMIQSTFWELNLGDTMAQPTFHAKVSNEPLSGAPKEDDPFESWPGSLTNNEDALNQSMQKLSLEQEKQIWLEQQKRIIEKHLN